MDKQVASIRTEDRIREIFADVAQLETVDIRPEDKLRGFDDVDSLDLAEFYMRVEEEFDVILPDRECAGFATIGDVVARVDKLKTAAA